MGINVIRKATQQDYDAVARSAARFCKRHGLTSRFDWSPVEIIEAEIQTVAGRWGDNRMPRIARLWQQCFCRALGENYDSRLTIAWGHVGLSAD